MRYKLFFFLIIFSTSGYTQVTHRNILSNKYSLQDIQQSLISKNDYHPFPKTPLEWKEAVPDSILKKLVNEGELALAYKFEPISATISLNFVRNGDRSEHAKVSFSKRQALRRLIIAESVEDEGRFTEAIINGVWSICEESFWGVPAHLASEGLPDAEHPIVELFSAETATLLALTNYFVGEKLDAINKQFRKRIYYETNKRVFEPMLNSSNNYGWMSKTKPVNNWNPWIHSNLIMTTLLLEQDPQKRAQYIFNDMQGIDLYLNGLGEDGGCDEGPSYWFAAGASVYDCLEFLQTATNGKVNVYQNDLIKKMASYIYKTHIGGRYFVNFSDADPKFTPDGLMIYRFGKAIGDSYLTNMGLWAYKTFNNLAYATMHSDDDYHRPRYIQNLLTLKKLEKASGDFKPIQDVWISDVQELTARSSNGFFIATHGGHNAESHNHNDVGDFIVYADDEPIIIDAGRGNYTARTFSPQRYELWFTQSQHHNLPIINGLGQLAGREFTAKNVKKMVNEKASSLTMDIAGAYDSVAGIKTWVRTVKLDRLSNHIEIIDSYEMNKVLNNYQQVFMTVCEIDISIPGLIVLTTPQQKKYSLKYDVNSWSVNIDLPSMKGEEYNNLNTKWDNHSIKRILLTHKIPMQKGSSIFKIERKISK
jgi:hypothetical protein